MALRRLTENIMQCMSPLWWEAVVEYKVRRARRCTFGRCKRILKTDTPMTVTAARQRFHAAHRGCARAW